MSKTLMIIAGGIAALVILAGVGIGVFLFMPTIVGAIGANSPTPTAAITANNTATPASNNKPINQYLKQYAPNIEQQLAQGLKLTSDHMITQLRSGKTLTQIATDQKVTGPQLNTVIANALQNGLQPAVTSGGITQKQEANLVKRFQKNPDQLGHLIAQDHKKGTPTPQP
jgi:hypothetical protein